ncbi:MAG: FIST N-terminal domain-containing protein [Candidatus Altiarchaeota archaeon]|nr:FIST N-terminal domain-containing protein [Candidatus Altiarchaeota archaeon]
MPELESNPDMEFNTVQREVLRSNGSEEKSDSKPEFRAAVGLSREWDARKAGREVARNTLEKLGRNPDFFLLFSTIHYEKCGGFQKFLDGVWDVLPKGTPLIGGTVAGFINPQGCFTRGATAMAVSYPNMDVAVGVGRNTKRNPRSAAKWCAGLIKKGLKESKYGRKYFITLISSAIVPDLPILRKKKVIRNFPGVTLFLEMFDLFSSFFQIGPGRDESIVKQFSEILPEYGGIGGASCDDLSLEKNVQYYMSNVTTNSIVSLGISIDKEFDLNKSLGLNPTGKILDITNISRGGYTIKKINHKPAVEEYLRLMGWSDNILDERLYRKVFYYPIVQGEGNRKEPRMFGLVYGNNFVFPMEPNVTKNFEIYTSSGKDLLDSYHDLFSGKKYKNGFIISCGTRLETLGNKIFSVKEEILDKLITEDYLLLFTAGEYIKKSKEDTLTLYQSNNALLVNQS